ncbi:hypothetical protein VPH35_012860 [Triticum aestivum]
MAVSRQTGWIAAGLLARLLMVAVLLMSVRFVLSNYIHWDHTQGIYKLQSYTYVFLSSCWQAGSAAAGFGATNDVLRYVRASKWEGRQQEEQALINYYNRAIVPVVFLLVGMVLSICATVVSARLRARAINDSEVGA